MSACFEGDDRRTTCPTCQRSIWLEDGCPTCETTPMSRTLTDATADPLSSAAVASVIPSRSFNPDPRLICGMHPAVAEHTLERCLNAFGGLAGLLVAIQAWEDEPDVA